MINTEEFDLLVEHFYEIERIIHSLNKEPHDYHTDFLLYPGEVHTLKIIAKNEGINQRELSDALYKTPGATSIMIDKLVKKGLVVKTLCDGDQRYKSLFLTDKGRYIHKKHMEYDENRINEWFHGVDLPEEQVKTANFVIRTCIEQYHKNVLGY